MVTSAIESDPHPDPDKGIAAHLFVTFLVLGQSRSRRSQELAQMADILLAAGTTVFGTVHYPFHTVYHQVQTGTVAGEDLSAEMSKQ